MSAMKRLLDGAISDDAARILRSAEDDAPLEAEEKQSRIVDALDVAPSLDTGAPPSRSFFRIGAWTALAALLVLATVLASRSSPTSPTSPIAKTRATPSVAEAPRESAPPSVRGVDVDDLPSAPDGAAAPRRPALATTANPVEDELVAIDAARGALASGNAADALARIAHCRKRFPKPLYAEEADVLEVQALAALGRHEEARTKAERFFASRPHSPYEPRVRAAIRTVWP